MINIIPLFTREPPVKPVTLSTAGSSRMICIKSCSLPRIAGKRCSGQPECRPSARRYPAPGRRFWNRDIEPDAERHGPQQHQTGDAAMFEHPLQRFTVAALHGDQQAAETAVARGFRRFTALQQPAAHHRRQGKETASEMPIATDRVTANSRNNRPGRPPISSSGKRPPPARDSSTAR